MKSPSFTSGEAFSSIICNDGFPSLRTVSPIWKMKVSGNNYAKIVSKIETGNVFSVFKEMSFILRKSWINHFIEAKFNILTIITIFFLWLIKVLKSVETLQTQFSFGRVNTHIIFITNERWIIYKDLICNTRSKSQTVSINF